MHRLVVHAALVALVACGASTRETPRQITPAPAAPRSPDPVEPIPREELRLSHVPSGDEIAILARGRWIGRTYDYDGDSEDFAGEAGEGTREVLELAPLGRLRRGDCVGSWEIVPGGGGESFTAESGAELWLTLDGGCPDEQVRMRVFHVHRLDDGMLVLIDGSTANVIGYRRARRAR